MVYAEIEPFILLVQEFKLPVLAQEADTELFQYAVKRQLPFEPIRDIPLGQGVAKPFKLWRQKALLQIQTPQLAFLLGG